MYKPGICIDWKGCVYPPDWLSFASDAEARVVFETVVSAMKAGEDFGVSHSQGAMAASGALVHEVTLYHDGNEIDVYPSPPWWESVPLQWLVIIGVIAALGFLVRWLVH